MAVAAAPKSRTPANVNRVIEQAGQDRVSLLEACEQIMLSAARGMLDIDREEQRRYLTIRWRDLDADERAPFELLHFGRDEFEKGVARLARVCKLQEVAGTSEDRTKASEQAAKSAKAAEVQGPGLRLKLLELQGQIEALEGQAKTDAQRVESMAEAVKALRKSAPEHVLAEANRERQRVKQQFHEELTSLESELSSKEGFAAVGTFSANVRVRNEVTGEIEMIPSADKAAALKMCAGSFPELIYVDANLGKCLNVDAFRAKQREFAAELPGLRERVAKVRQAKADAMAEVDKLLDTYAR